MSLHLTADPSSLEVAHEPSAQAAAASPQAAVVSTVPVARRPATPRRVTDPLVIPTSSSAVDKLSPRPRNSSPFARPHLRARSTGSTVSAPPMVRAHSSPSVPTLADFQKHNHQQQQQMSAFRPSSPLYSPSSSPLYSPASVRRPSPLRRPLEDSYNFIGRNTLPVEQTIAENSELYIAPRHNRASSEDLVPTSLFGPHGTAPRVRRRPSSPVYSFSSPMRPRSPIAHPMLHTSSSASALSSSASVSRFNEAYPMSMSHGSASVLSFSTAASSSMPSTPTSFRSRSPSISSLETIPDSPDAEAEAVEEYRLTGLRVAAEKESEKEENRRKGGLEVTMFGRGRGGGDKRKRWSVCGAERRGDLDLETIWED